ncbi:MAG: CotH kinase family protein, partial [Deltaproteobacteria bacterium]|nr:CotH kinase family protein [Deltaproteobacteria bacterium]
TWANVKVNGKSYGLFSLVEEVDGRFTTDRWPLDGDGNLYKEAWPTSTPPALFGQKLATNKTTASHDALMGFASAMAVAPGEALGTTLGRWMDLPSLYRYMAVDDAIFNCDGITAFYAPAATGPAWGNHNFYLYQEQNRDFFWLIPWDMDATLSVCAAFVSVPRWNNVPTNCDQNFAVWGGVWAKPPGCDRFFQAVAQTIAQDPALYRLAVDELLAGPFSVQTLTDRIDHWSAFIRDAVVADPTARGEAAWKLAVQELKAVVPRLRERLTPR